MRDSAATVSQPALASSSPAATNAPLVPTRPEVASATGISVAGGLADLSDTQLESLLGEIGSIDASNLAEPEDVIPTIGGVGSIQ